MSIVGTVQDLEKRFGKICPEAFQYLIQMGQASSPKRKNLLAMKEGEVHKEKIEGTDILALHQAYYSRLWSKSKMEAHRKFIDFQYFISGRENIAVDSIESIQIQSPYSEEADATHFHLSEECPFIRMGPGMLAIFFPEDAHAPGLAVDDKPQRICKCVLKIPLEQSPVPA